MEYYQEIRSASEILTHTLHGIRKNINHTKLSLYTQWKKYVGNEAAVHSKPVEMQSKVLVIEVDHPSWMQKLRFETPAIINKIKKDFPNITIRNIRMRLLHHHLSDNSQLR